MFITIGSMLGIRIVFLSPYSPDFNAPIEEFWRDLKKRLKRFNLLYRRNQRAMIYILVRMMRNYNIRPILNRIGYSRWCASRQ